MKKLGPPCDLFVKRGGLLEESENLARMSPDQAWPATGRDTRSLQRAGLRVEIVPEPFAFAILRGGRRLLGAGQVWAADCEARDRFIPLPPREIAFREIS